MSDFVESVDDMVARHFAIDGKIALRDTVGGDKNWANAEKILYRLIRSSLAHARNQVENRRTGKMTFDEAIRLVHTSDAMVARPNWNIFCAIITAGSGDAIRDDAACDGSLHYWTFDNCDGSRGGSGHPYHPDDEDRAATDWMVYQSPTENWIEPDFDALD